MNQFNIVASNTRSMTDEIKPISSLFDSVRGDAVNETSEYTAEQGGPVLGGLNM